MRLDSLTSRIRMLALNAALVATAACVPARGTRLGVVYITETPPPQRVEVVAVRPGAEFVWIDGYWTWGQRAYVWVPGRWERPPRHNARWVRGRWRNDHRGWYWEPGRWQ
jgi:hypothetical protein